MAPCADVPMLRSPLACAEEGGCTHGNCEHGAGLPPLDWHIRAHGEGPARRVGLARGHGPVKCQGPLHGG
eukprot:971220-Pyramimonas_sp.AAC.2